MPHPENFNQTTKPENPLDELFNPDFDGYPLVIAMGNELYWDATEAFNHYEPELNTIPLPEDDPEMLLEEELQRPTTDSQEAEAPSLYCNRIILVKDHPIYGRDRVYSMEISNPSSWNLSLPTTSMDYESLRSLAFTKLHSLSASDTPATSNYNTLRHSLQLLATSKEHPILLWTLENGKITSYLTINPEGLPFNDAPLDEYLFEDGVCYSMRSHSPNLLIQNPLASAAHTNAPPKNVSK